MGTMLVKIKILVLDEDAPRIEQLIGLGEYDYRRDTVGNRGLFISDGMSPMEAYAELVSVRGMANWYQLTIYAHPYRHRGPYIQPELP